MLSEQDVKPAPISSGLQANFVHHCPGIVPKNSFNCTKGGQTALKLKCCVLYFVIQVTDIQSAFTSMLCSTDVLQFMYLL